MNIISDLTGKEFLYFKVIKVSDAVEVSKRGVTQFYWLCQCKNCGNACKVLGANILSGHTKSCGCLKRRGGKSNPNWRGVGDLSQDKFREIKRNAKARHKGFHISLSDAWGLFQRQNGECALTGLPLHLNRNRHKKQRENASIDRIDSSKPYILDNIRWVHKDVNMMKHTMTDARLIELASLLIKHLTKSKSLDKVSQ